MSLEIRTSIKSVLTELNFESVDFVLEHPKDLSHGDYACNVAMALAQKVGVAPREVAEKILHKLDGKIVDVEKIEIAGPGFLNFYFKREYFTNQIANINKLGEEWGKNSSYSGKKVLVEYTDPNPFKEFHIGHIFTNTVGESIARLFMMAGADTKRVNYQGDVGLHVACALWGMQKMGLNAANEFGAKELGMAYVRGASANKEDENAKAEIKIINKAVYERTDDSLNELYDYGRQVSLEYFESIYKIVDTKFDHYFFESVAGPKGKELVLANPEVFVESDGAKVFKGEEYGLHTRVFINSEGLPTYEAKELALAQMKVDVFGDYDLSVVSTASEINEYFKVLLKAMSFVYPELANKTEHIGHGMVKLSTGKMSSRTGNAIPAIDFIEDVRLAAEAKMRDDIAEKEELSTEIAIAAIKYATLRGNILQDTVFDKEKALSFEGDSGPYLQYTHARICSVIEKANKAGVPASVEKSPDTPYELEKTLYRFTEVVELALHERAPHRVVGFLTEIASTFNSFYANEKIADETDEFASYKVALATAVKQTIKNGLWILAIKAPEQM